MKKLIPLFIILFVSIFTKAQVKVTNGPNLVNDPKVKMNRMLGGDDQFFYSYRVRSKGRGTSYIIEKHSKAELKTVFSKEVPIDGDRLTWVTDVYYASDKVYLFFQTYNKETNKMTLYYHSVTPDGEVSEKPKKLVSYTSDHYEFVEFEIMPNPSKTKFMIKTVHKDNKADEFRTDFVLIGADDMKKIWTKKIEEKVGNTMSSYFAMMWGSAKTSQRGFIGWYLDDSDNVYYATSHYEKDPDSRGKHYKAEVSIIKSASDETEVTELAFEEDFLVQDVMFSKTPNGELVVGGFLKDVIERKGRDLVKVGIFSFKIKISNGAIVSQKVKMFGKKLLAALESSDNGSRYMSYKLDYILPVGDDVFYVGEQYSLTINTYYNSKTHSTTTYYDYTYMDVIVAKLNAEGNFDWVKNAPLRNYVRLSYPHVFKQYIAVPTSNAIYILNDDHAKNLAIYEKPDFEPSKLKSMVGIHGSNFVFTSIALGDGALKHDLIFNNKTYCFAPIQERNPQFMPPSNTEIFVKGGNNEIYIYTENKGKDKFAKLTFE